MNIIIKKQELENSVSIPVTLEYKSNALPLELIPLCIVSIDQSFSLFPRELQLAMNIIRKKGKLENPGIDPGASRIQIERSTTNQSPFCIESIHQYFRYILVSCN